MLSSFILLIEWEDKIKSSPAFKKNQDTKQSERGGDSITDIIHHFMESRTYSFGLFYITIPWHLLIANQQYINNKA